MRLDRPSSGGSDRPPRPGEGTRPPLDKPVPQRWDNPREAGEGTGWPKDKKPEVPKTPEERIKALESENKSLRVEYARLTGRYEHSLRELKRKDHELDHSKSELTLARNDNSRLTETNSLLVRDNMALRDKTATSSAIDRKTTDQSRQREAAEKKPHRRNWFPTDKVAGLGGAAAGAAGTYAVMVGRVSSKEEAFAVACAGAGMAALTFGREITDKINDWRDKRAEKNAER